jgi:hypothetical protein
MNTGARARPLRLFGRLWRLAARRPAGTLLLIAIPTVLAGLAMLIGGLSSYDPGIIRATGIVLLLLSPTLTLATALYAPRVVRGLWRRFADRRDDGIPLPDGPPIEKLASDLRRLLWHHDRIVRSIDVAARAGHLRALEGAITICATQAARALDVPYPDPPTFGAFHKPQLRRLLRGLAAAGLVLPPAVGLLAPDGHR